MARDFVPKRKRDDTLTNGIEGKKRRRASDSQLDMGSEEFEEERDGLSEGEGDEATEVAPIPRDTEDFNKPPTRDELRSINEASDLFRSNAFKLAIDALLPNVRPKESRLKPLNEFLRILYTSLMSSLSISPSHPLKAARALSKQGVSVPYVVPLPTDDTAWKVAYGTPSEIVVVGSWATQTGVKSPSSTSWTADVAVEMPITLFQEKDYLDCRFFHKRAYYLACLASVIQSDEKLHVDVAYDSPTNPRLTTLILTPRTDGSPTDFSKLNGRVRLIPTLPSSSPVSLHHISPAHRNLRVKSADEDTSSSAGSTPIYNADLLVHTSARERLLGTHNLVQDVASFRDALALLRVWASQRGYGPGPEEKELVAGFDGRGYFWTAVMHAILTGEETFGQKTSKGTRRPVGHGLSSYQLFRAALDFLATHDFISKPFFTKGGSKFPPGSYESFDAVFVDISSVNVLAGIPVTSLDLLRRDARITLNVLDHGSIGSKMDPFDDVFLRDRRQLFTRFDVVVSVDLRTASLRKSSLIEVLDHGSPPQYVLHTLSSILRRALGDRVHAMALLVPMRDLRPLSQGHVVPPLTRIHLGLLLDTNNAFRLVDHGPAASEQDGKEAIEFRDLWGNKAELRRFKDGRIVESVVWDVKNVDARARIPADVVCHILSRHLGLDVVRDVQVFQKNFDDLLRVPDAFAERLLLPGVQPGFKSAMSAFDNLIRQLKNLDEEIPLAILDVSPVSTDLRYTNIFTPAPRPPKSVASLSPTMRYLPSIEIIIQFERSGRWPDDLAAIQKMKLAFFEQIASALMTKVPGLKAGVVVGNQQLGPSISDGAYLEIVTPDGWAFSARIWHEREETLLRRLLLDKKSSAAIAKRAVATAEKQNAERTDRHTAQKAYEIYARRYLHAPKHHRAVANMCHRFSAFAGTVRLVKRWLAAHWLFEGHVSCEAVELLCAFIFVGSTKGGQQMGHEGCLDAPATKELGFFRVLAFLKEWAWETGLFVSLYETDAETNDEEGTSSHAKVGSGSGVWTISTAEDRLGQVWTTEGPDAVVARRIKMLAKASSNYVLAHEWDGIIPKTLFLHPADDYDILIRLKPEVLCRMHQSLEVPEATTRRYANIPAISSEDDEPLRADYDPALMFYNDLKHAYHGTLAFFFDPYGGSVIGAVWDPSLFVERPFRVLADYSSTPSQLDNIDEKRKQKPTVVLNRASVLAEIERLGEGLVKSIELQRG